jgi:hypothetical protein
VIAEVLAIAFMGCIAAAAKITGVSLLLFPELAALSHDVLTRPQGQWASQPIRLIATPTLTATAGLIVTRHAHYGAVPILAIVLASLTVIWLLRSSIGPAISAGVLPIAVDERHWMYPVAICLGLLGLSALSWIWQRWGFGMVAMSERVTAESVDEVLETMSDDRFGLLLLLAFVLCLALAGQSTGLHLILFPPLIVMAYEIFGHPELPGWMKRPTLFPVVCFFTASLGLFACRYWGAGAVSVVATVAISIVLLRTFQMHMPPALAVGLLPFVMKAPDFWYPISVAIGTTTLTLCFLGRAHFQRSPKFAITARRLQM